MTNLSSGLCTIFRRKVKGLGWRETFLILVYDVEIHTMGAISPYVAAHPGERASPPPPTTASPSTGG